jgi:hypothetical protein
MILALNACNFADPGNGGSAKDSAPGRQQESEADGTPSGSGGSLYAVEDVGGDFLGYVTGFVMGYAVLYDYSEDVYLYVDLESGSQMTWPLNEETKIYFTGENCTGQAYVKNAHGQLGKTLIRAANGQDYVASDSERYDVNGRLETLSMLDASRPSNEPCIYTNIDHTGTVIALDEVDTVPDLTDSAPISFQGGE